jgi:transcriptional regulator with XRE-family HTH domain
MARDWLKQIRTEIFPSQAALARAAGIQVARYSRIERGYCDLRDDEAKALAEALKQPVEFVLTGTRPSPPKAPAPDSAGSRQAATAPVVTETQSAVIAPPASPKGLSVANGAAPAPAEKEGTDLSDPANFTLMPPSAALVCGALSQEDFRKQLQSHVAFATKVLHTSKVKPRVWVAWRDFNKEAQKFLRGEETVTLRPAEVPPTPVVPAPALPRPEKPVAAPDPQPLRPRTNKNVFGYFVEIAKESLREDKFTSLSTAAAEAKKQQPEIGFMKHFKRLAEAELHPADFEKISAEAARRHQAQIKPQARG